MKSLKDHILESQQWIDSPAVGDDFAINVREECLLESHILEADQDIIVIEADQRMIELLEHYGMLGEEQLAEKIQRYGPAGANSSQGFSFNEDDSAPLLGRDVDEPWDEEHDDDADLDRILELAGTPNAASNDPLLGKAIDLAAVQPMEEGLMDEYHAELVDFAQGDPNTSSIRAALGGKYGPDLQQALQYLKQEVNQKLGRGVARIDDRHMIGWIRDELARMKPLNERDTNLDHNIDQGLLQIALDPSSLDYALDGGLGDRVQETVEDLMRNLAAQHDLDPMDDVDKIRDLALREIKRYYGPRTMDEAKYQGREVKLGKPMQGDVKKFKVYVRDPKTGNVKKVNFGDKTMRIKKSDPARRRSFRARHNCANPGPRTKARYWSCRKW